MFRLIRGLVVLLLVVVLAAVAGAYFLGYRVGDGRPGTHGAVATSGRGVDTAAARERGAELGEKAARAANSVQDAVSDGAITAKIKSKMALDDTIKSRDIHVSTSDGVVTLTGRVGSASERDRAVQLSRETEGVKSVTDQLEIK
jgi:osmotically-inducible protein OsmY